MHGPRVCPGYTAVMEKLIRIMDARDLYNNYYNNNNNNNNKQPDYMKTTLDDNTRLILLQNFCVFQARMLKTATHSHGKPTNAHL